MLLFSYEQDKFTSLHTCLQQMSSVERQIPCDPSWIHELPSPSGSFAPSEARCACKNNFIKLPRRWQRRYHSKIWHSPTHKHSAAPPQNHWDDGEGELSLQSWLGSQRDSGEEGGDLWVSSLRLWGQSAEQKSRLPQTT